MDTIELDFISKIELINIHKDLVNEVDLEKNDQNIHIKKKLFKLY